MFSTVSAQVPTPTYIALMAQLRRGGRQQDLSSAITAAIVLWLAQQQNATAGVGTHGYQWKSLFLPEGTELRSWSYGEHNYARVEGDKIIHQGHAVSPNQFAHAFARTTRNAWEDLYIRRPGDKRFKLACLLRQEGEQEERELKQMEAAQAAGPATQTGAASPASPAAPSLLPLPDESIQLLAAALASALSQFAPPRNTDSGPRWDLPERRKFRYRLEDVAFE